MDIVERLRDASKTNFVICWEAADEIERLRKALKVIADSSEEWGAFAESALQQKESE